MNEMMIFINKLLEPETLNQVLGIFLLILYLIGRITKKQFIAEQMKLKGIIDKSEAKQNMAADVLGPVNGIFEVLKILPVVGLKLPLVQVSVPEVLQKLSLGSVGLISDILHNLPVIGTNINTNGKTDNLS